jgi:hypothetical protein
LLCCRGEVEEQEDEEGAWEAWEGIHGFVIVTVIASMVVGGKMSWGI